MPRKTGKDKKSGSRHKRKKSESEDVETSSEDSRIDEVTESEREHDPLSKTVYQRFNFKADTFPEIFPLGFFQQPASDPKQGPSIDTLKKQIKIMSDELQREFENNKVMGSLIIRY